MTMKLRDDDVCGCRGMKMWKETKRSRTGDSMFHVFLSITFNQQFHILSICVHNMALIKYNSFNPKMHSKVALSTITL